MTRRWAIARCFFAALVVLTCAALFSAAALVPAPPTVLPCVLVVCIGWPMVAAWELRASISVLRGRDAGDGPLDRRALATLRRHLDRLPETQHPLGL
jgi:hypothetical protein